MPVVHYLNMFEIGNMFFFFTFHILRFIIICFCLVPEESLEIRSDETLLTKTRLIRLSAS